MDLSTASQFTEVQQQEPVDEAPIAWWTFLTSPSYTLAAGMLCGIVVNFLSRNFPRQVPFHVNLPSFSLAGNSKMVLIVRTDLGMTKGKAAAQCAHAALGCYKKAVKSNAAALEAWEKTGQAKICLKIDNAEAMMDLATKARENGIAWSVVRDAGRTQVEAGSLTVLGIGPADVNDIDQITGHLKLFLKRKRIDHQTIKL